MKIQINLWKFSRKDDWSNENPSNFCWNVLERGISLGLPIFGSWSVKDGSKLPTSSSPFYLMWFNKEIRNCNWKWEKKESEITNFGTHDGVTSLLYNFFQSIDAKKGCCFNSSTPLMIIIWN